MIQQAVDDAPELFDLVERCSQADGMAVICSTLELDVARRLSGRVYWFDSRELLASGTLDELAAAPTDADMAQQLGWRVFHEQVGPSLSDDASPCPAELRLSEGVVIPAPWKTKSMHTSIAGGGGFASVTHVLRWAVHPEAIGLSSPQADQDTISLPAEVERVEPAAQGGLHVSVAVPGGRGYGFRIPPARHPAADGVVVGARVSIRFARSALRFF